MILVGPFQLRTFCDSLTLLPLSSVTVLREVGPSPDNICYWIWRGQNQSQITGKAVEFISPPFRTQHYIGTPGSLLRQEVSRMQDFFCLPCVNLD